MGIPSHRMAIQHMKLPDLFEDDRRKSADGKIDNPFPQPRSHAAAPSRGRGGSHVHDMSFKGIVQGGHEEPFGFVSGNIKKRVFPNIQDPHRGVGEHEPPVLAS